MSLGVIRLKYGIENAGVDIRGYRDGEFKKFEFSSGTSRRQIVVLGSYESYRNDLEFLMYHLLKVMDGEDFALYHHKGSLFTTPNVTLRHIAECGLDMSGLKSVNTIQDCWSIEAEPIILELG